MGTGTPFLFDKDQVQQLESLVQGLNEFQLAWLAGYLSGVGQKLPEKNVIQKLDTENSIKQLNGFAHDQVKNELVNNVVNENENANANELSVLFGSRTGNGASIANKLKEKADSLGIKVQLKDMNDYPLNKLKDEKNLLVIVSTHGEGEPPVVAEEFYNFLHGKKAPTLSGTKYSVLALGDKSYIHFCKTGIDVDKRLAELGAQQIIPRVDCDVDFATPSEKWIDSIFNSLPKNNEPRPEIKVNGQHVQKIEKQAYSKQNPFEAKLLDKIKLSGRGSEKETYHYELSLANSGLAYEPGDALGIYPSNSDRAVSELIETLKLFAFDIVLINDEEITLREALTHNFEISVLTPDVISNYNKFAQSEELTSSLADSSKLKDFIFGRDMVDLVREYPAQLLSVELIGILRKLQPRLYSIASSPAFNPDEVHVTVATVRHMNGRYKEGACSTYLADRLNDDVPVKVFIEKNTDFRLPKSPDSPVIMVGPGTGIAPFRAFLQERDASGAKGKNWLFYGDRHFATDFLYQTELQNFLKKGTLTKLHVAFSRDKEQKVYVQHKLKENAKEVFNWLEDGAYFYVCGDREKMWHDVNQTLLEIIQNEGGMTKDKAEDYIRKLKKEHRYQSDVY
jgi:sulfite reductase (NADPH) flavoprotein alpha-component